MVEKMQQLRSRVASVFIPLPGHEVQVPGGSRPNLADCSVFVGISPMIRAPVLDDIIAKTGSPMGWHNPASGRQVTFWGSLLPSPRRGEGECASASARAPSTTTLYAPRPIQYPTATALSGVSPCSTLTPVFSHCRLRTCRSRGPDYRLAVGAALYRPALRAHRGQRGTGLGADGRVRSRDRRGDL